jgi:hypothetical protein
VADRLAEILSNSAPDHDPERKVYFTSNAISIAHLPIFGFRSETPTQMNRSVSRFGSIEGCAPHARGMAGTRKAAARAS